MPQGIDLNIPFPGRISPDVARADASHLGWPSSFGLLPTAAAEARHRQGKYAELAGRFHPAAVGDELDLAVDQLSWFFLFDDEFDGHWGGTPERAAQLAGAVEQVLDRSDAAADSYPIAAAFGDLWARSREGMSDAWCRRASMNWRTYLRGYVAEAENRLRRAPPHLQEQLALRVATIGVQPILDIAERLGHFELPEHLARTHPISTLSRLASEVVALDNDIVSVEKEEAIGDLNLLLYLESLQGLTRRESIGLLQAMVTERIAAFVKLGDELTRSADEMPQRDSDAVRRYYADALCAVMRGAYDWEQSCARYRSDYISFAR